MGSVTLTQARSGRVRGTTSSGASFEPALWLFAVPDGGVEDGVMLSCEYESGIYMGRLDLEAELLRWTSSGVAVRRRAIWEVTWEKVETALDGSIADHWHLYLEDEGVHVLTYAENGDVTDLYAFTMDPGLANAGAPDEVALVRLSTSLRTSPTALVNPGHADYALNDHWIVATGSGVLLGLWDGDRGDQIALIEFSPDLTSASEVGTYSFTGFVGQLNTAGSAFLSSDASGNPLIYVATQGSWATTVGGEDAVRIGEVDPGTWTPPSAPTASVGETLMYLLFPTVHEFSNGWRLVTFIRVDPTNPAHFVDGDSSSGGDVVRQLFDETWTASGGSETLRAATLGDSSRKGHQAYRPHVSQVGDYLITCWDEWDVANEVSRGCRMRIDEVALT